MLYDHFMTRYEGNPILSPRKDMPEADALFNCGQTMYKGKTILLVAVVLKNNPMPRMHVAESDDGINFTIRKEPFITKSNLPHVGPYDNWPIDPRITYFPEEDVYYIMRPGGSDSGCVAILGKTKDWETYEDVDLIALPSNRVPCLFPEKINGMYARLDRPYTLIPDPHHEKQNGHIWISYSPDLIFWGKHRLLLKPWCHWNGVKIGPTPPIKTPEGWLVIIHGVKGSCSGARYSLGAMLLDLNDPEKITGKMNSYIITPDMEYEFNGRTPNCIFSCGAIADLEIDRLRIYYGAADTCIGLATCKLSDIIQACKEGR